jgi:CheY-like chemotaxis protein
MNKPRLLLADDHTILVEGLKALLAPEFEVVATAGDGRAVLEAAEKHQPDLILLDISMPALDSANSACACRPGRNAPKGGPWLGPRPAWNRHYAAGDFRTCQIDTLP